jgi:predicted kinase
MDLVIFIGLQASGKTSFYRAHFAGSHAHLSKDNFPNNRNPNRRQLVLLEEALAAGRSAVVDNTNPSAADRALLIALGRSLGARIIGYYFESRMEECKGRNQGRAGKARVPDVALHATMKKLERPTPSEGFDELFFVRMDGSGGWVVSAWQEGGEADEAS